MVTTYVPLLLSIIYTYLPQSRTLEPLLSSTVHFPQWTPVRRRKITAQHNRGLLCLITGLPRTAHHTLLLITVVLLHALRPPVGLVAATLMPQRCPGILLFPSRSRNPRSNLRTTLPSVTLPSARRPAIILRSLNRGKIGRTCQTNFGF